MKRIIAFAFVAFLVTASNCGTGPQPVPTPAPDAAPPASCATACATAASLGCTWAAPTPNGATCENVCANAMVFGLRWDLNCRASATSCAAAAACP